MQRRVAIRAVKDLSMVAARLSRTGCNAVRARMVSRPEDYRWSSYAERAGRREEFTWVDTDPRFEGLRDTPEVGAGQSAEFVRSAIPAGEWAIIRSALQRGQLKGNQRFVEGAPPLWGEGLSTDSRVGHRWSLENGTVPVCGHGGTIVRACPRRRAGRRTSGLC